MKKILKLIYKKVPFKKNIFSFVKIFYIPPKSIFKHLSFKGAFRVLMNNDVSVMLMNNYSSMENELFWLGFGGLHERISMEYWLKLAKYSNTILDIGAYHGIYALAAKSANKNAAVYAFEPVPQNFNIMKQNIEFNNFDIYSNQCGISDHDGTAVFCGDNFTSATTGSLNKSNFVDKPHQEIRVQIRSIASFIKEHRIKKIDLIKIDVEGHEYEVILGMKEYLKTMRPQLLIEITSSESAEKLKPLLEGIGYHYFDVDEVNKPRLLPTLQKSSDVNLLIFTHDMAAKLDL